MKKQKTQPRVLSAIICAALILSVLAVFPPPVGAAYVSTREAAGTLYELGLFLGSDTGFELERNMTKQEAVVMLARLLGVPNGSAAGNTFSDVEIWAEAQVRYASGAGYVRGLGDGTLGANNKITAREYITFVLRALGYDDAEGDFNWQNADVFADKLGLTRGEYSDSDREFLREDAVLISYTALTTATKSGEKLIERLVAQGAVDRGDLLNTKLSGYANYGKPVFTAAEIYQRASSATFYMEFYEDEEALEADEAYSMGSGFFVSPDGLAYLTYHEIELKPYARIYTADGQVFEDITVLYYDGYRDSAIIKVGKTAQDGSSVSKFPYLLTGDSEAISNGELIYTMSSPAGLQDCISSGLISTKLRTADDPDYPLVQFTAPISSGSSGGALLNAHCEVIGVLMGSFIAGNDLNLAIPINEFKKADISSEGKTLSDVYEYDLEQNLKSTITVSTNSITIKEGESVTVIVTRDSPGTVSLFYEVDDFFVLDAYWGNFSSKTTVPLTITGIEKGEATLTIRYVEGYGNPDAEAIIKVRVV